MRTVFNSPKGVTGTQKMSCGRRREPAIILTLSLSKGEDNAPK